MKIRILDAAKQDLIDGFQFYKRQSRNIGDYFLNCTIFKIGLDAFIFSCKF